MAEADANNLHHYNRNTISEMNVDVLNQWNDKMISSHASLKDIRKGYTCPVKFKKNNEKGEEESTVEVEGVTSEVVAPFSGQKNDTQRRRRSTHLVEQTSEFFLDDQIGGENSQPVFDLGVGESYGVDTSHREGRNNQGRDAKKRVSTKLPDSHILNKLTRTLLHGIQEKMEEEGKEVGRGVKNKRSGEEKGKCTGRSNSSMHEQNLWKAKEELGGESSQGGEIPNGGKWTTLNSGSQGIVFRRKGQGSHVSSGSQGRRVQSSKTSNTKPQGTPQLATKVATQVGTQVAPETEQTFYVYQTEGRIPGSSESNDLVGLEQHQGNRYSLGSKSVSFVEDGRHSSGGYVDSAQGQRMYFQESIQGGMDPYVAQESLLVDGKSYVVGSGVDGMGSVLKRPDEVGFHLVGAGHMGGFVGQDGIASQAVHANWSSTPPYSSHPDCGTQSNYGIHLQRNGHPNYGTVSNHGNTSNYANYNMEQPPTAASIRICTTDHPNPSHIPQKKSNHVLPPASSAKKNFFCNSSVKKKSLDGRKQPKAHKTEILIYPNGSIRGSVGPTNGPKRYSLDRHGSSFLLSSPGKATIRPPSSNVFIRTKSLQRQSEGGKMRKGFVSPLNKFSLGRQKSVPVKTHSRNATSSPMCTQEITYSFPSQGGCIPGVVGDQRVIQAFASSLPHGTHHSELLIKQNSNSGDGYKKEINEDVSSYVNKCSTDVSSRVANNESPMSDQVNSLNRRIGKLTSRIRSINAEKWNLSELARLYKNECNRLREVIAKNKQAHYDPVNFRKVNYQEMNEKLEEENENLRNQMKALGKVILSSHDINGIKKILAKQLVNLNEENEKYRQEIKLLKKQKEVNREVLFNLSRGDVSTDAIDSVFMQTKNIVIEGHQTINVFYLNLKNLIDELFQRIKFLLLEDEYTADEKMLYVTSLEELVNENFEEINHIVIKINELRKKVKDVKAHIFDTDRSNPNCSCKPSRIILEDDINHLEEELHNHSIMLKNLRKKNLSLCLESLHSQFDHDVKGDVPHGVPMKDHHKAEKQRISNKEKGLHRREERNSNEPIRDRLPTSLDKGEGNMEENPDKSYHNRLHEKIRVIEHQLHTLNDHINSSFCDGDKEHGGDDSIPLESEFCRNRKGNVQPGCAELDDLTKKCTTKRKQKITDERQAKGELSYISSSSPRSSVSDDSASASSENKNWLSAEEVERSKSRMIKLLAMLKGKHNADLVENTKSYVSSFGEYKENNKYNLQKIYDNLEAIRNTIKNTEDDTERNILALIESQANEIKIFGNCVDDLKTTMAS
ncbi:conserved protein, unknown function [Plasmodium knowlesi strain H]|uniref:Uncharacterized protein n=3 Tax=Plasmodium knowlesi TaxID=5850 RepID=A0A679KSK6_PLAKH|nr:conserved protein, unknown function [Plasmodium knowlesi strain H]OTN68312.1 Uncharacterized protein PKNOH_S03325100 [Plasmodium knowlesi]CAA9987154.1 conserved protein, unknown function [Plasmodium knowlesi strain H]SBO25783.1 conserved Plasmodium protein, unknown function [Plasmodium knowlesi strain H]VVS76628.1 conserved protein, unknown function [Plasmodium knowlesi strain H]